MNIRLSIGLPGLLFLLACDGRKWDGIHDMESIYERDLRVQSVELTDRVRFLEGRFDHLRDCLLDKMTMAPDWSGMRIGILTCAAASRKP